jgi:hypothetical protein
MTAVSNIAASLHVSILTRLAGADKPALSAAGARHILTLGFSSADKDRMHTLAAKTRNGRLTSEDHAEIEAYSPILSLLGILKSKARRALRRRTSNGKVRAY